MLVVVVAGAPVLVWVTVTVTVVVVAFLVVLVVFAVLVDFVAFVFVDDCCTVPGGCTVTVLDADLVEQMPGTLALLQRPVSGGPTAELVAASVLVSVTELVPAELVAVSVAPPPALVVVGVSLHAWVPTMWQMERPMPVVVLVSVGTLTAARVAPEPPTGLDPPAARTLTGTAATTTSGAQRRTRASTRADRSRRGTALPSQGSHGPPPRPCRAACICSHPGTPVCRGRLPLCQGGRMQGGVARTRNSVLRGGF